jgi:undecaprenyl-diphosphatase
MDIFSSIILGIVQGITEFLPISSSGHLILAREFLGLETSYGLSVDAVLQLATSFAILLYFRSTFWQMFLTAFSLIRGRGANYENKVLLFGIILGTIPAVILGLLLEDVMATTFRNADLVAWTLLLGAFFFIVAERLAKKNQQLTVQRGFWVGIFQTLALIPGMSRSGSSIAGGLLLGLSRETAARFSFMLGFPIIFGSGLKKLLELETSGVLLELGVPLLVSAVTAFVVGLIAIHFMLRYLKNHTLNVFAYYRIVLALLIFVILNL